MQFCKVLFTKFHDWDSNFVARFIGGDICSLHNYWLYQIPLSSLKDSLWSNNKKKIVPSTTADVAGKCQKCWRNAKCSLRGEPTLEGRKLNGFWKFFDREEFNEYFLNSQHLLLVLWTTCGNFVKSSERRLTESSSELAICVHSGGRNFDPKPKKLNFFHFLGDF